VKQIGFEATERDGLAPLAPLAVLIDTDEKALSAFQQPTG